MESKVEIGYIELLDRTIADAEAHMPEVLEQYRERVERGANLMDKHMTGWADMINLEILDISNTETCVLGQCFPEETTLPRWAVWDYSSLDDALAHHRPNRLIPDAEKFWADNVCVANYDAGVAILSAEYGEGYDDSDDLSVDHGFNDHVGRFGLLDALWSREVRARQS